ncbi:hypothetical protein COU60_02100 [Candidatus Pacearchaeota archaeon CG10_big_fil_rev_8_21_14_0_10_34_76]|nr:MAG: hypothetical protein COU60_02100 [Candidatus Pacearchaeota archaeon CG10_big_fil_rev_8_21_14_0_10_34_76]
MDSITTIQLRKSVKKMLESLKEKKDETYEEIIVKLIDENENEKKKIEQLMIEEYKETAEESLKISKEWEGALMDGLDKNERWNY